MITHQSEAEILPETRYLHHNRSAPVIYVRTRTGIETATQRFPSDSALYLSGLTVEPDIATGILR